MSFESIMKTSSSRANNQPSRKKSCCQKGEFLKGTNWKSQQCFGHPSGVTNWTNIGAEMILPTGSTGSFHNPSRCAPVVLTHYSNWVCRILPQAFWNYINSSCLNRQVSIDLCLLSAINSSTSAGQEKAIILERPLLVPTLIYTKLILEVWSSAHSSIIVLAGLQKLSPGGSSIFVLAGLCPAKLARKQLFHTAKHRHADITSTAYR